MVRDRGILKPNKIQKIGRGVWPGVLQVRVTKEEASCPERGVEVSADCAIAAHRSTEARAMESKMTPALIPDATTYQR